MCLECTEIAVAAILLVVIISRIAVVDLYVQHIYIRTVYSSNTSTRSNAIYVLLNTVTEEVVFF